MSNTNEKLVIGGIVGFMLLGLSLLRFPLTWLVLGVINLFIGEVKPALICIGIGAVVFVLTFKVLRQQSKEAPLR